MSSSENATNQGGKRGFLKSIKVNHGVAAVLLCAVGAGLISMSYNFPEKTLWHDIFRDGGIALIPIGLMTLVYEILLRKDFLNNMSETIRDQMPGRYTHMREAGIVDVYEELRIDKLKEDIDKLERCEIRILDIWMENFNRIQESLLNAVVKRNCTVKILFYHPDEFMALKRRSESIGKISVERIQQNLLQNIQDINYIQSKIAEKEVQKNFEAKLYRGFISVSMIGYGSAFLVGNYLRSDISSLNPQLKVSGENTYFYKKLSTHFHTQWNDSTNVPIDIQVCKDLENRIKADLVKGGA